MLGDFTYCPVCLYWSGRAGCPKSPTDSVSHICTGDEITPIIPSTITPAVGTAPQLLDTNKLDGWKSGSASEWC